MEKGKYIVFLDLDGTITGINSGYALVRTAQSEKLIGISGIFNALILSLLFKLKLLPAEKIIYRMGQWLRGIKPEVLAMMAEKAVDRYLADSVFTGIREEIKYHRERNAETAILSSAIREICAPLAQILDIDHIVCTEMEVRNGVLTGVPSGNYCYGEEKKRQLISFCENRGLDRSESFYYADSFSDLPALEAVGYPVCINPDRKLKSCADKKGWQVKEWRSAS